MSTLSFVKYEGAGNDFILIDDRVPCFPVSDKNLIRRLCHRKFGIGADGILLLQLSDVADFRMRIFNSDGSEPEGCGNGLRCLVRFIADLGLPQKPYRIAMGERIVETFYVGDKIATRIGAPQNMTLNQKIGPWEVHSVDTGVPHAVVFVPDVHKVDLMKEAPFLRHHPAFHPRGANVNFAALGNGSIRVRTFERGVEGETLACGTGAAAVAAVAAALFNFLSPIQILYPGGELEVLLTPFSLAGPAKRVFSGSVI